MMMCDDDDDYDDDDDDDYGDAFGGWCYQEHLVRVLLNNQVQNLFNNNA